MLTSATLDKVKSILKHRENTISQGLHLNDKKMHKKLYEYIKNIQINDKINMKLISKIDEQIN